MPATKIFVNLPVKNLDRTKQFFSKLGYSFNPQFTDQNAACLVISDDIYAMLITEAFFGNFTKKAIVDATKATEVIVALSTDSRADVDRIVDTALRHRDAIGHKRADQQHRQIEQRQIGGARHRKRSGLAKLANNPAPRARRARSAQIRKQAGSVDHQKIGRGGQLRCDIHDGDVKQALGQRNGRQLAEQRAHHAQVHELDRPPVEAADAVERRRNIGRQGEEHTHDHDAEREVELRDRPKSQHDGGRQKLGGDHQQDGKRPRQAKVYPQHFGIELAASAITIDARLERKKPVDRTKLQAGVDDQHEISGGIDRQPCGENVVGPVVQENRNQRDLLRDSQCHLQEIGRPSFRESARAAGGTGHRGPLRDASIERSSVKTGRA